MINGIVLKMPWQYFACRNIVSAINNASVFRKCNWHCRFDLSMKFKSEYFYSMEKFEPFSISHRLRRHLSNLWILQICCQWREIFRGTAIQCHLGFSSKAGSNCTVCTNLICHLKDKWGSLPLMHSNHFFCVLNIFIECINKI